MLRALASALESRDALPAGFCRLELEHAPLAGGEGIFSLALFAAGGERQREAGAERKTRGARRPYRLSAPSRFARSITTRATLRPIASPGGMSCRQWTPPQSLE